MALIDLLNRNDESYVLVYSALAFVSEQAQIWQQNVIQALHLN